MSEIEPCGSERDAAIAREIHGWDVPSIGWSEQPARRRELAGGGWWWEYTPKWSTDNHAALDILMEMQRRGFDPLLHGEGESTWVWVEFYRDGKPVGNGTHTFADAVSAAALRAVRAVRAEAKGERA